MITIQEHLGIYQCNMQGPITEDFSYFARARLSGMKFLPTSVKWLCLSHSRRYGSNSLYRRRSRI